jgi:hypothetical protein
MSRARSSHVWDEQQKTFLPRDEWEAKQAARRGVAAIHRDFAEPLFCHGDGKHHSSRSTYDAAVRRAGLVEVGRTEMKRLERGPAVRATPMQSVRHSLREMIQRYS